MYNIINMKIKNYKRGYINTFYCVIHGTLEVSKEEFKKILPLLKKYSYNFEEDIQKNYFVDKQKNHYYCFGVKPMEKIVSKYNLTNYKRGNYQIKLCIN